MHKEDSPKTNGASPCPIYYIPTPEITFEEWLERHCRHDDALFVYREDVYGVLMLTNARTGQILCVKAGHEDGK